MTGVTRLARTSVLILLLLGGLSPVPAFAAGPPWYFYNQCTGGGRYDYEIKVSGTIVPTNGIWWVATVDTVDGDKIYGTTPAGAPGPCGYPKFQGTKDTHPDDLQGLMQGVPDGSYAIADNNSLSTDAFDPSSGYGNPAYHFFHIKNGLVYMDTEPNSTTTTATTTTTTPPSVHNDVVWASTSAQPNELRVYTPSFPNPWFGGTALNPSVKLGTWDKPDFTATASTTVHIWSRWNGVSSNILDVVLRTSKGGDPFFGSAYATTTAEFITPNNDSYYRLGVTATSALEEYVIPARIGETLHQGDEVWALLAPSYASYGADHWVGSNGSMPYMEICEGPCDTPTTIPPPPSGPSSVLFLPGIESSRLYKPRAFCVVTSLTDCVDQLWEPNIDGDVQNLFMNPDGTSIRSDIYTKDVVDSYLGSGNTDIYKSFSTFMDSEVAAHKVATWKAAPYDWRYAIDTVVNGGTLSNGKVSYAGIATSSYLVNQVLALASSSPAGKVTIIAHSNGGLVAKLLVNKLKDMGKGDLVDKIVFVGVPQLGTPKAIPSILHGYEQANAHGLVTRLSTARELAKNSPGAYTLLPSESYTNKVATPTVLFDQDSITTAGFRSYYGISLDSQSELENFLTGALDQRPQPVSFSDTDTPIKISSTLLTHAKGIETTLDRKSVV